MHDASVRLRDAAFASLTNEPAPANGVTLVAGSDGGPSALSGLDGGMYSCDAGGEAALPAFLAFESGFGYVVEFDACQLLAGVFQGQYRLITPVPRSGNLGSEQLVDVYIEIDNDNIFSVAKLDAGTTTQFADRVQRTYALSVDRYVAQEGGDRTMIDSLSITRSSRIGTTFEDSNDNVQPPTFRESGRSMAERRD